MELLIFWLGTVIMSMVFETSLLLKIVKDIADEGYKIDMIRVNEFREKLDPETKNKSNLALFIPVFNLFYQLDKLIKYKEGSVYMIDELRVIGSLVPMTNEEIKKYKEKPSSINAFKISVASEGKNQSFSVIYNDGEEKSTIWFTIEDGRFSIVRTEGPVSNLSFFKQRVILEEKLKMLKGKTDDIAVNSTVEENITEPTTKEICTLISQEENEITENSNYKILVKKPKNN